MFKHNIPHRSDRDYTIVGLERFQNQLERNFFSKVTIKSNGKPDTQESLILDINSNFSFEEAIYNIRNFSDVFTDPSNQITFSFHDAFKELLAENELAMDIEELYITFSDTSIIVQRIYEHSIPEQIENIFKAVIQHSAFLTKGMTEVPFEIYVPIFEQVNLAGDEELIESTSDLMIYKNTKNDYFGFWGLYFDSEENAVIYDLKNKSFIKADLFTYH